MRTPRLLAVLAASVLLSSLLGTRASAQGPARPPAAAAPARPASPSPVALIDVAFVFKNHTRFQAMMNDLKAEADRAEQWVKTENDSMRTMIERLKELQKGTEDYRRLTEEITGRRANLGVKIQLQKDDFLQREARNYYIVYQEILQEVDYLARANGIAMVVKFSGDKVDPQKPETVLQAINRDVVWSAPGLDITEVVLQRLNGRAPNPGTANSAVRPGVNTTSPLR